MQKNAQIVHRAAHEKRQKQKQLMSSNSLFCANLVLQLWYCDKHV